MKTMATSAFQYHEETSYDRHGMAGYHLDWAHRPEVFKHYPGITPVSLPRESRVPEKNLSAVMGECTSNPPLRALTLKDVSLVMRLTYSVTAKAGHGGDEFHYRSVASAGALYPCEIYMYTRGIRDLDDGLYHFSIARHGLSMLRKGHPSTPLPAVTFFFSTIWFRSAWKYRARSYRYNLLDTGHLVENLILACRALELPCPLTCDFEDHEVNRLLGLDESREVSLAPCRVPGPTPDRELNPGPVPELPESVKRASRVSEKEVDHPAVGRMHWAGTAIMPRSSSALDAASHVGLTPGRWNTCIPPRTRPEILNYPDSVFHRRSKRNFVRHPISRDCMASLLEGLCRRPGDGEFAPCAHAVCTGFIIGSAEGFEPGIHALDPASSSTAMVARCSFTGPMARSCLDQAWPNAAVHVLFMTNLRNLERMWGPREGVPVCRHGRREAGRAALSHGRIHGARVAAALAPSMTWKRTICWASTGIRGSCTSWRSGAVKRT